MITDKNEILKKLGITLEQVFDPAPEWAQWFAIDNDKCYWFYEDEPTISLTYAKYTSEGGKYTEGYHLTKGKPFDMTDIDWRECCWERPVDESKYIGCLGWFADYDLKNSGLVKPNEIKDLVKIEKSRGKYSYCDRDSLRWDFFKPLTIAELTEYLQRAKDAGIEG
jgi:hypothetical protein